MEPYILGIVPVVIYLCLGTSVYYMNKTSRKLGYSEASSKYVQKLGEFMDEIIIAHQEGRIDGASAQQVVKALDKVFMLELKQEIMDKNMKNIRKTKVPFNS
jgi:hypothetical protein